MGHGTASNELTSNIAKDIALGNSGATFNELYSNTFGTSQNKDLVPDIQNLLNIPGYYDGNVLVNPVGVNGLTSSNAVNISADRTTLTVTTPQGPIVYSSSADTGIGNVAWNGVQVAVDGDSLQNIDVSKISTGSLSLSSATSWNPQTEQTQSGSF